MAQRRMFSLKVVDTDAFLDMSLSAQALYFHLAMRADDDGFVANPKKISRMLGVQDDDYKVLIVKRFIIPFESGICVIKHWLIHNLVRSDRYVETQWAKEKQLLLVDVKTRKYSLNKGENHVIPNVIPNGNLLEPQVRLGKVRLGKKKHTTSSCSLVIKKNAMKPNKMGAYNESLSSDSFEEMIDLDSREVVREVPKTSDGKIMRDLIDWAEKRRGFKFVNRAKQLKALSNLKVARKSPADIRNRWIELEQNDFYQKTGFDFMSIANSFDRK